MTPDTAELMQRQWGRFDAKIECAVHPPAGQPFPIRGVANTFQVMHSGRLIHPRALDNWLSKNPAADLAFLAQHGGVRSNFASVGRINSIRVDGQGLYFAGWVGHGTDLMDETRTLLGQGVLKAISIGWDPRKASYVTSNDADLDPLVRTRMDVAGVQECKVYSEIELVEISAVDVGDDAGALLAARAEGKALEEIRAALMEIRADVAGYKLAVTARQQEDRALTLPAQFEGQIAALVERFWTEGENRLIDTIAGMIPDARGDYAAALLAEAETAGSAGCGHAAGVGPDAKTSAASRPPETGRNELIERLRRVGREAN